MRDEEGFLEAIRTHPDDDLSRLVYADWLDERGDVRGEFLRLHLALRSLPPDHVHRVSGEHELSRLRKGVDPGWLTVVEPEWAHLAEKASDLHPTCRCMEAWYENQPWPEVEWHIEPQDTECDAWKRLLDLVEQAAVDGRETVVPFQELDPEDRKRIVPLPATVAKLKSVRRLLIAGCDLVRIPPEIAEMTSLEEFDAYMSYRLHWYPYEITRCPNLRQSAARTRALYGNYKYRPPFPRLAPRTLSNAPESLTAPAWAGWKIAPIRKCSVCNRSFEDRGIHRVWISLRVATDVLPLLVNACSGECVQRLPRPPRGYVQEPHRGGPEVQQPAPGYPR